MHQRLVRILLLNLPSDSLGAVNTALSGQGYEIATENGLAVDGVLRLAPEVLVTEALPSDLSCCGLISQLKSQPETSSSIKIIMLVRGDALERARALDLGADDVLTFPFEPLEFAARVRTQFRERRPEEELKTMLKYAVQREQMADIAVESLNASGLAKGRFWLIPAIFGLAAVATLAALITVISTRHSRKDALQLHAEIARLSSGLGRQDELLHRVSIMRDSLDAQTRSDSATRDSLKSQSEDLRKKVAAADGAEADSLKQQLADTQNRLKLLENEGKVAETVVRTYGPSVCLLHVVVEFLDKSTGKPIQVAVDATGKPEVDDKGMVQLDIGGTGPHLQLDFFGTGFLASRDGRLLTNHHVAEPWWSDEELKQLLDHGATAYVLSYKAYFPGTGEGIRADLDRISSKADVATLKLQAPAPSKALPLDLDDSKSATVTGEPVVLIGYPTAIDGILARAGSDTAQKIAAGTQDVNTIVNRLSDQKLIRPTGGTDKSPTTSQFASSFGPRAFDLFDR